MKPILVTIALIALCSIAKGQQADTSIYTGIEREPAPEMSMSKYLKGIQANIKYPDSAANKRIEGKVVLTFVVEKDGSLSDIQVLRGVSPDIDAEAVRVLKNAPKWKPGKQHGKLV